MYCPSCGGEISDDDEYCSHCGNHLGEIPENTANQTGSVNQTQTTTETNDTETNDDSISGINITLGKIVAYPIGLLLMFLSLLALFSSVLAAVLFFVSGLIVLPIFRTKLKQSQDIHISGWAAAIIVVVFSISGFVVFGLSVADSTNGPTPGEGTSNPELIEAEPSTLLPTIDDYESGWRNVESDSPRQTAFLNVNTNTQVTFNVTIHDSISEAESDLSNRNPEDVATEDVSVGEEGYYYSLSGEIKIIQFRIKNVVGQVRFIGNVLSPKANTINQAEKFETAINNR